MPSLPFKQVDVFTSVRFKGNPVAVVFEGDELSTEQLQQIANWTNLRDSLHSQVNHEPVRGSGESPLGRGWGMPPDDWMEGMELSRQ